MHVAVMGLITSMVGSKQCALSQEKVLAPHMSPTVFTPRGFGALHLYVPAS